MKLLMYLSWVLGPALEIMLLAFLVRRQLRGTFPRFFSYVLFQVLKSVVLFAVYRWQPAQYFYAYWTGNAISVFLGVLVMDEIWRRLFEPWAGIQNLGSIIFRWACFVLLVNAIAMAIVSEVSNADRVTAAVLNIDSTMRLMQCGLVLLLLLLSRVVKSVLRQQVFGIALGFGLFATIELTLVSVLQRSGSSHIATISLLKSFAYSGVIVLWIAYVRQGVPVPAKAEASSELSDWNLAMAGLPASDLDHPFLTVVEAAVERVLSRSSWSNDRSKDSRRSQAS